MSVQASVASAAAPAPFTCSGTSATASLVLPLGLSVQTSVASAATPAPTTCTGTSTAPGTLPGGTYTTVTVSGVCEVKAGQVTVTGDVSVQAGAALIAAFANNSAGPGTSGITVDGNVNVASGATLLLGCDALHFACVDDPNQNTPTLNSPDSVTGSIEATDALGVVVHNTTIGGDAIESGGGGGPSCAPSGIFATFMSPVYSDYEDNTIGGNLRVTGLTSCWFGALRNHIGGSDTFSNNVMTDPDANENLTNQIGGNLLCTGNSPAIQYGDSSEDVTPSTPNVVGGFATGQCAFSVEQPRPAPVPGPSGNPAGPLTPIATPSSSPQGYWLAAADGGVFSYGATFFGSAAGQTLTQPIAGMAAVPGGGSYNLAEGSGTTFGYGSPRRRLLGSDGHAEQAGRRDRPGSRRERLLARSFRRWRIRPRFERTVLRFCGLHQTDAAGGGDCLGAEQRRLRPRRL